MWNRFSGLIRQKKKKGTFLSWDQTTHASAAYRPENSIPTMEHGAGSIILSGILGLIVTSLTNALLTSDHFCLLGRQPPGSRVTIGPYRFHFK